LLQRRARKKSGTDTRAAHREAIVRVESAFFKAEGEMTWAESFDTKAAHRLDQVQVGRRLRRALLRPNPTTSIVLAGFVFWYRMAAGFPRCSGVNGPKSGPTFVGIVEGRQSRLRPSGYRRAPNQAL